MARRPRSGAGGQEDDLFSAGPEPMVSQQLAALTWGPPEQFLVNHARSHVKDIVWGDLIRSRRALVVAGFASIAKVVELVAAHSGSDKPEKPAEQRKVDLLLGTEPFGTDRLNFGSASAAFTAEVRRYWVEERGVSLRLSAKIVQAIAAIDHGWFQVRFIPGNTRLHAKIYAGDAAVAIGSSNFTDAGLSTQFEANVRFENAIDPTWFNGTTRMADNYWQVGKDWSQELKELLNDLLQFVPWEEALARACADLLEGQWAARYLGAEPSLATLWPSQLTGIAQAMWVIETVGSVLVADATGSGKTRMGAQLTRAVRDRSWSTGRVRRDLTVVVCPPAVTEQWQRESMACGLTVIPVSQGKLSRVGRKSSGINEEQVRLAQILAVDEAHNFLSKDSIRTRQIRESTADHVLLFTATPINRGAQDILSLVDLLGADNFEDETLDLLDQLGWRGGQESLTSGQRELLRREIQRFTVRRTKHQLNEAVDHEPDRYRHPITDRICRYPDHDAKVYSTGETPADEQLGTEVRGRAKTLKGLISLGTAPLAVPVTVRREYSDQRWLDMRLGAAAGLATYNVVAAMRSSTAALLEHLIGTEAVVAQLKITGLTKSQSSGAIIDKVAALRNQGPPEVHLSCPVPPWLTDRDAWREECEKEIAVYEVIRCAASGLSDARERAKATHLTSLTGDHQRILAFDRHPISLAAIRGFIDAGKVEVITASGNTRKAKEQVRERFAADSQARCIALCTDAMSEGLNLQGASAIVHLDLPTTLRVAEQRVGRVDRMDSPYDVIEAWYPDDGPAFATSANELLIARNNESASLLGSNLPLPDLSSGSAPSGDIPLDVRNVAQTFDSPAAENWDGINDALDPVRRLVDGGPDSLLTPKQYMAHRTIGPRVVARISPLHSMEPWAFFASRGHAHGAPRWVVRGHEKLPVGGHETAHWWPWFLPAGGHETAHGLICF